MPIPLVTQHYPDDYQYYNIWIPEGSLPDGSSQATYGVPLVVPDKDLILDFASITLCTASALNEDITVQFVKLNRGDTPTTGSIASVTTSSRLVSDSIQVTTSVATYVATIRTANNELLGPPSTGTGSTTQVGQTLGLKITNGATSVATPSLCSFFIRLRFRS